MKIAVDAMGGDYAPHEIVKGAVEAAAGDLNVTKIFLVGDQQKIEAELKKYGPVSSKIAIHHATEQIGMDESPAQAVRRKKDSSIGRAVDLVKSGEADAIVSAGNTGAVVVAATLKLRLLEGIERPAIAAVMPTRKRPFVLVDAGANIDSSPKLIAQFAIMGNAYSKIIFNRESPVVGLLSIGGEDIKGNETTKEAFNIISNTSLNFRGNIEGHDLFEGETDVVACDGFVGNVVLKTSESASKAIGYWMKEQFTANPLRMLGSIMLKGALKNMKQKMDPELFGGAQLLGVRGVCIITHGASSSKAIYHSIRVASESVNHNLNDTIVNEIAKMEK